MKIESLIRNHTITKCFSFFWFNQYVLRYHFIFNPFLSVWCLIVDVWFKQNVDTWTFMVLFYFIFWFLLFLGKVYPENYIFDEIWKHGKDFSINVHYQCFFLLILLERYTNAELKICRSIRLRIEKYAKSFTL